MGSSVRVESRVAAKESPIGKRILSPLPGLMALSSSSHGSRRGLPLPPLRGWRQDSFAYADLRLHSDGASDRSETPETIVHFRLFLGRPARMPPEPAAGDGCT